MNVPSEKVRAYVYRILVVLGPVLAFHGIATDVALTLYLALAAEVLGVGLAVRNTSTRDLEEVE